MADGRAAPAAGSRPTNPTQATPPTGSQAGCPKTGSTATPTVVVDREEITVIGRLPEPETATESEARASGRASRFREETRSRADAHRRRSEDAYGRKVAWGVEVGGGDDRRSESCSPTSPFR